MTIINSLNKLVNHPSRQVKLPVLNQPDSISKKIGNADFPSKNETSAGIASPLTVVSKEVVAVEVFDDFNIWSTIDEHVTKLSTVDAQGRSVVLIDNTSS